jgi:hypothetical protein
MGVSNQFNIPSASTREQRCTGIAQQEYGSAPKFGTGMNSAVANNESPIIKSEASQYSD